MIDDTTCILNKIYTYLAPFQNFVEFLVLIALIILLLFARTKFILIEPSLVLVFLRLPVDLVVLVCTAV